MLSTQKKSVNKTEIKTDNKTDKEIDKKKEQTNLVNIINIETLTKDNLLVEHDKTTKIFTIKNRETIIGTFTAGQIFKYINPDIDNYLLDISLGTSIDVITKYLCKFENDELILISHLDSPITGNIDILTKIYRDLYDYEQTKLPLELEKIDINIREQVRFINREFIYTILLQIIKLFSSYTSSNTNINQQVKDLIIKYTIGAVYKLSTLVKNDIDYNLIQIKNLSDDMSNLNKIRENMQEQINIFKKDLEIENTKIDNIIMNLSSNNKEIPNIHGGNNSDNSTTIITSSDDLNSIINSNNKSNNKSNNNISKGITSSLLSNTSTTFMSNKINKKK